MERTLTLSTLISDLSDVAIVLAIGASAFVHRVYWKSQKKNVEEERQKIQEGVKRSGDVDLIELQRARELIEQLMHERDTLRVQITNLNEQHGREIEDLRRSKARVKY